MECVIEEGKREGLPLLLQLAESWFELSSEPFPEPRREPTVDPGPSKIEIFILFSGDIIGGNGGT